VVKNAFSEFVFILGLIPSPFSLLPSLKMDVGRDDRTAHETAERTTIATRAPQFRPPRPGTLCRGEGTG